MQSASGSRPSGSDRLTTAQMADSAPMIVISGIIRIDAARRDDALALIAPLVEATNAEAGCNAYDFWEHPASPGTFRVFEEWVDQAALEFHFGTPHMAAFMTGMGSLGTVETDIDKYRIEAKVGLMD